MNRNFVWISILFILTPVFAHAEDPEPLDRTALTTYVVAAGLDLHSTYRFLQYEGFREGNPVIRGLDHRPKIMLTVGGALDIAAVTGGYYLIGKKRPKLMRVILYTMAGVRFSLAYYNYRIPSGHQRKK